MSRTTNSNLWAMQWVTIMGLPIFAQSCLVTPPLLVIITLAQSKVRPTSFSFSSSVSMSTASNPFSIPLATPTAFGDCKGTMSANCVL